MKLSITLSILFIVLSSLLSPLYNSRHAVAQASDVPLIGSGYIRQQPFIISEIHSGISRILTDWKAAIFQEDPTPTETATEPAPSPTATETLTPEPSPSPTATETVTPSPSPSATPSPAGLRPVIVIASYSTTPDLISPGKEFKLEFRLVNQGQDVAKNILLNIPAGEFVPIQTGGVLALDVLDPGDKHKFNQPLVASTTLAETGVATLEINASYTDSQGQVFSEAFTIALNIIQTVYSGPAATATPTPTPTVVPINSPQLVITSYQTDVTPLQPGSRFTLMLSVFNAGNAEAKRVTMIVGGASLNTNPNDGENDPLKPGNITSSGGEFTNFSPVDASNIQSLGDLDAGSTLSAQQSLIVNVTTNPGVYSLKISFAYLDAKGNLLIDDQVISLLVYTQPVVEINFYREPDLIYLGQPNILPIQIINLGRKSAVFGTMTLSAPNGQLQNNTIFVGPLDMGGYFPLDATWFPETPGQVELNVSVEYTDDFNQAQRITRVLSLNVLEPPVMEPGVEPGMDPGMYPGEGPILIPPESQPETFWQKVVRFISGMFGLDSGLPTQNLAEYMPPEGEVPTGVESIIVGPSLKGP